MKKIAFFVLLIGLFWQPDVFEDSISKEPVRPNIPANNIKRRVKEVKEVVSISHTVFLNNKRNDDLSLYLSTVQKDRAGCLKLFFIASSFIRHLNSDGWFETTPDYKADFVRDFISIKFIQIANVGIQVAIERDDIIKFKIFSKEVDDREIVIDILSVLFGQGV